MSELVCPESLDWHRLLLDAPAAAAPLPDSPAAIQRLEENSAPPVDEFLQAREDFESSLPEQGDSQIRPVGGRPPLPEHDDHMSRVVGHVLDWEQVKEAIRAIRVSLHAPARQGRGGAQVDSDSSGSDDEGRRNPQPRDPTIAELDAGSARLITPESLLLLQELLRTLPQAARKEALQNVSPRILDGIQNQWILPAESATAVCCDESVKGLVCKFKITTKVLCVMWQQLDKHSGQLCQQVREEYFAEVAGPCINNLLETACSFSNAKWTAAHIAHMLPIFDTLADALFNIQGISFTRSKFIAQKVADIFRTMLKVYRRILDEIAYMHTRKGSAIHPATDFLTRVLEFFYHHRDMVHPDDYIDIYHGWVSTLEKDAEKVFEGEKDRQLIFILNNMWFVWQKRHDSRGFLSVELVEELNSLIQKHMKSYIREYWVPLLTYLEGDCLRKPRRASLDNFAAEFGGKCDRQMKWKLQTELKKTLRENIKNLIVQPYEQYLRALQTTPSPTCFSVKQFILDLLYFDRKRGDIYTVEQLESTLVALFER